MFCEKCRHRRRDDKRATATRVVPVATRVRLIVLIPGSPHNQNQSHTPLTLLLHSGGGVEAAVPKGINPIKLRQPTAPANSQYRAAIDLLLNGDASVPMSASQVLRLNCLTLGGPASDLGAKRDFPYR